MIKVLVMGLGIGMGLEFEGCVLEGALGMEIEFGFFVWGDWFWFWFWFYFGDLAYDFLGL